MSSQEPPGFKRVEVKGKPVCYLTIPDPSRPSQTYRTLTKITQVKDYLVKQGLSGDNLERALKTFDFTKRGLPEGGDDGPGGKRPRSEVESGVEDLVAGASKSTDMATPRVPEDDGDVRSLQVEERSPFDIRNLLPDGIKVEHRKELKAAAQVLDERRRTCPVDNAAKLAEMKLKLAMAKSVEEMVSILGCDSEAMALIARMMDDWVLQELLTLRTNEEVICLSEWPNSEKSNFFADVVRLAARKAPVTLDFLLRIILKGEETNVEPKDVISIATVFAHLASMADKSNNAFQKIQSLQMKMQGLTDEGLQAQKDLGLAMCARTLRLSRDQFREVADKCLVEETMRRPSMSTIDNCDQKGFHTTVEYVEVEHEDTSHLSVEPLGKEETLALFDVDQLLLSNEHLQDEKKHLEGVILLEVGKVIAQARPEQLAHWLKVLPLKHSHPFDHLVLREASVKLRPPHYFQETKADEMVQLAVTLQDEVLDTLKSQRPNDVQLHEDLDLIRKKVPGNESSEDKALRLQAEQRVKCVVQDHGEWIGHGDLLTFQKVRQARLARVGSVSAVGRLEFLGPFRLGLFHLQMNKLGIDIGAGMPDETYNEDILSLKHVMTLLNAHWFTGVQKNINKTGMFEKHKQYHEAYQLAALVNMYENYLKSEGIQESSIKSKSDIENFLRGMLDRYGCKWYWDPRNPDDPLTNTKCDLMIALRDQVIRLLWDLAFTACEKHNDSKGLRTLRRISVAFFRNKAKAATSKYALYTFLDLVVDLSASERSRRRMDCYVTVNPSGTVAGGMSRDKFNEIKVKEVKQAIARQHSALSDLQIQTLVGSLSVMTALHHHNLKSRLYEFESRHTSSDCVGDERRDLLRDLMLKHQPFDLTRPPVTDWAFKPRGSPFAGLTEETMAEYLLSVRDKFILNYPTLS